MRQRGRVRVGWKAETGVFLGVAFVAAGLLGMVQPATGVPPVVLQLSQFGPAVAVLVVALLWRSRIRGRLAGALPARGRDASQRGWSAWLLVAAVVPVALAAVGYAALGGGPVVADPGSFGHPFALIVVAQLVGACGEEIGWRCFLQPLLGARFGTLVSSVLVGAVWGVWHVGVFAEHPAYAAGFLLAAVAMSVVLGTALDRIRSNRLLLAGGYHALVNLGMLLLMDEESGAVVPMVLFGVANALVAVVWTRAARSRRRVDTIMERGAR
ncbi:CPBP family intramembrane glutamic endopeptidase [Streptomyces sp. NPDC046203]|uniref:CPBP family intramembrane glutamic endopeptidase n=1 Tax=Streptomyces sp. NPDC046203 TaxID=3154602 RepID=UPI0034119148